MASELRVNTLKDASGNNSIGMSYVAEGSAKAWVHYDHSQIIVRNSFNISSMSDVAEGRFTQNFSNSFQSSENYTHVGMSQGGGTTMSCLSQDTRVSTTSSSKHFSTRNISDNSEIDRDDTCVVNHGDLA